MGFKARKKLYKLVFADEDMQGLEVTMTSVPVGKLLEIQELSCDPEVAKSSGTLRRIVEIFVGAMLSWNLEDDDDQPVPVTVDGALGRDPDFLMQVIGAWTSAISGVSGPLEPRSSVGSQFPEASIPMEAL